MSNVRLKKTLVWNSALIYNGAFYINTYHVDIRFITVTTENDEQNVAYERVKEFIYDVLNGALFIAHDDPAVKEWQSLKQGPKVIVLPDSPADQIIGIMLYLKLNAIMEGRMMVTDIEISSDIGDNMVYAHHYTEEFNSGLNAEGWWTDARPTWFLNSPKASGKDKVVSLNRISEWVDYDLQWGNDNDAKSSVVFAVFNKDEDK